MTTKKVVALFVFTLLLAPWLSLAGGVVLPEQEEQRMVRIDKVQQPQHAADTPDVNVVVNMPKRPLLSAEIIAAVGGVVVALYGTHRGVKSHRAKKANL